ELMMDAFTVGLLRQVPLFGDLDQGSLERLAARSRRRRFAAHEALFHEGDPGYTLYVVISGHVNVQRTLVSGEVFHIGQCGPGEPVGEMSLFDGKPRMADVVTAEPCEVL